MEGPIYVWSILPHWRLVLYLVFDSGAPLLIAGWEYRHWDDMLRVLADATIKHLSSKQELRSARSPISVIQKNWAAVFESGKHETIEVWSEGKHLNVLKLLLTGASKVNKFIALSDGPCMICPIWYGVIGLCTDGWLCICLMPSPLLESCALVSCRH